MTITTVSFDISTKSTGYCVWHDKNLILSSSIIPGNIPIYDRLIFIKHSVRGVLFGHKPHAIILEDYLYSHKLSRRESNRALVQISEVGGVIKNIILEEYKKAELITYPIHEIKRYVTGHGNASKVSMQKALPKSYRFYPVPKIKNTNFLKTEDEVDSFWVSQKFFDSDYKRIKDGERKKQKRTTG